MRTGALPTPQVHGKPVDAISGSWLDHITWLRGDSGVPKKYFEYGVTDQERPEPSRHPLPSDSRFREDVQHLIRCETVSFDRARCISGKILRG